MKLKKGFTLIELLVVVGIIGILASVVLASINSARARAQDIARLQNVKQIQTALSMYYIDYGAYPVSLNGDWAGAGSAYGSLGTTGSNGYIPNLAPTYIPVLPVDPKQTSTNGYVYKSDGLDYFFMAHGTAEGTVPTTFQRPSDPTSHDIAIYTPGFANSTITDTGGTTQLATPVANPVPGSYAYYTNVSFSADAGATIHYTTDGSNPTSSSPVYSAPIMIPLNMVTIFKAYAVKNGYSDSNVFSGQYVSVNIGCFLPGTMIETPNGEIPIENIKPGQQVLAFDSNEQVVTAEVTKSYKFERNYYYKITTATSSVKVTAEHPFYVGNSKFSQVQYLKAGDIIYILNNNKLVPETIISNERIDSPADVYNLSVTTPNTYFADNYAVHNKAAP